MKTDKEFFFKLVEDQMKKMESLDLTILISLCSAELLMRYKKEHEEKEEKEKKCAQ